MSFDPDAYLNSGGGGFDPDAYLGKKKEENFNPDNYLKSDPKFSYDMSIGDFLRESVLGNIPMGIAKGGHLALQGLETAGAGVADFLGMEKKRDELLGMGDRRSASLDQFAQEHFGGGTPAQLGQSLGTIPAMINPISAIPAAVGAGPEVQRALDKQGVDPETAAGAAYRQMVGNAVTGMIPFGQQTMKGAAGMNVASGWGVDYWTKKYLEEKGYGKVGEEMFNPNDPVARITDVAAGVAGAPGKPKSNLKLDDAKNRLNDLDKAKAIAEEQTRGEKPIYVDNRGEASTELGTRITEDPAVTDYARSQVQDRLREQAAKKFDYWEPRQDELFDPISGPHHPDLKSAGQQELGLETPGKTLPPEPTTERKPGAVTYLEGDTGVRALEDQGKQNTAALGHQADAMWYADQAKKARAKGNEPLAVTLEEKAKESQRLYELASKEFKTDDGANANAAVFDPTKPPPYGEPMSPERREYTRWEYQKNIYQKEQKLATLEEKVARGETINWNREWEGDTSVRSIAAAKAEIAYFKDRLATFNEQFPPNASATPGRPGFTPEVNEIKSWTERVKEIADSVPDHLSPTERSKWIANAIKVERNFRNEWFNDYSKPIIPDKSIINPDGSVNLERLIETILNDQEVQLFRPQLAELMQVLAPYIEGLRIEVAPENRVPSGKQMVPGYYNSPEHRIVLGQEGWTVRIILHELVHAATARAINAVIRKKQGGYTSKAPEALKALDNMMEYLRAQSDELADGWYLNGGKIYGLSDILEFVAEVMTNRYLQGIMRQQPAMKGVKPTETRNMFTRFLDVVKDILGIKKNTPAASLLDQAVDLVGDLMKWQKDNAAFIDSAMKQNFPSYKVAELEPLARAKAIANAPSVEGPKDATTKINDTVGMNWVGKDPVIDDNLVNKIKGEKDGSSVWALTPGALLRSFLNDSTLGQTVYRFMDNASKRAEYYSRKIVEPAEKTVAKLLSRGDDGAILHDILKRELKNGRDYTPDELRQIGISDDLIMAHLEFRTMMEEVLKHQNQALADKGLPPVKAIDAYLSARWSGPWRVTIKDKEGRIVWQVAEQSRRAANRAVEYIKSKDPNLVFDEPKYAEGFNKSDNLEAGYHEMLKLLDPDDPRVKMLEGIYKEYALSTTEDIANQEKHFLTKTGVRGWAGDRAWAKSDSKDMFIQQFQYAKNALKWSQYQKAVEAVNPLLRNPDLQESQKNNIGYAKEYMKSHIGFGTNDLWRKVDNSLAKFLGSSPETLQSGMGAAKSLFYLSRLGLSIPFMAVQLIQPMVTAPAWHSQLTAEGFKHNPILTTLAGFAKGGNAVIWHYANKFGREKLFESFMDGVDKDAVRYMEANGIVDINPMSDIKHNLRPEELKVLTAPYELTISQPEVIARSIAFMSFVDHLKQSDRFDTSTAKGRYDLFQKAEDMTKVSMTDYRTQERALQFERMGLTGDALATLHAYQLNNLAQLTYFSKQAINGNVMPLFTMIFMLAASAGLSGLWFVDDLDDLLNNLKKLMPKEMFEKYKDKTIKNFMLENFGELVTYGMVSKLTGTNLNTRLTAADQIPVWPFEDGDITALKTWGETAGNLFPFAGTAGNTIAAPFTILNPNEADRTKWEAAYKAAPFVAQGPMERLDAFNAGDTSKLPSNLDMGEYRRTEEEKSLRDFGFRSLKEQKFKDNKYSLGRIEKQIQDRMNTAGERARRNFLDGNIDKGVDALIDYEEYGGDKKTIFKGMKQAQFNEIATELDRREKAARGNTKQAIIKLQRYLNAME